MGYLWWWMLALPAVILSQVLIFLDWNEAGYGTIANIIIVLAIAVGIGQWGLEKKVIGKIDRLSTGYQLPYATEGQLTERLNDLPDIIKKWLLNSNTLNQKIPKQVFIKQSGELRTEPDGRWMKYKARQWSNPNEPAFIWKSEVNMLPGFHLSGLDSYLYGQGNMYISMMSVIPIVDVSGPQTDQGSLLRWLAEIAWYPQAALHPNIIWKELDSTAALAEFSYNNQTVEGIFFFNINGDLKSFKAERYFEKDGVYSLEEWEITVNENGFKTFNEIRIPAAFQVKWNLKDGTFHWLNMKLDSVELVY